MAGKNFFSKIILCLLLFAASLFPKVINGMPLLSVVQGQIPDGSKSQNSGAAVRDSLSELNNDLKSYLQTEDMVNGKITAEMILKYIPISNSDNEETISVSYYLLGIYCIKAEKYSEAIRLLGLAEAIKAKNKDFDERYARINYNLGVAYFNLGDFINQEHFSVISLDTEKKIYGESSPKLIKTCNLLALSYLGLQEYEKSLEFSKTAMTIAGNNPGSVDMTDIMAFYNNLGVTYIHLEDYSKAKVYLEKTESFYNSKDLPTDDNYFSLLNNLAITNGFLGFSEKSGEYYEKGIHLAGSFNSVAAYNYINSYAILLGKRGKGNKGEALLYGAMVRSKNKFGEDSPEYFSVLFNYAEYLRDFMRDNNKAIEYYKLCINYLGKNKGSLYLKDPVYLGYSLSLSDNGENYKAIGIIQSLLFPDSSSETGSNKNEHVFKDPDPGKIKADKTSLKILQSKYLILWRIYNNTQNINILETASSTAKLIVEVLEKVRINISEEDSRLILGDRYRDSYLRAIRDFNLLYRLTGRQGYLEDAFEFSEKSKVAGLLTATRELNASQFNIPADLSELEKRLKRDISLYNEKIAEEQQTDHVDTALLNKWKGIIFKSSLIKDSLVNVFEKKYPGYYSFKYNTSSVKMSDLPRLTGRNVNYVNYVVSDTMLYIFVVNRKTHALLAFKADSTFYSDINEFRSLLAMPSPSGNAREAFENFQKTGYRIYQKIIEPVRPYLISKKLLISPDNILSYIPFETIPVSPSDNKRILYNKIPYLMNEFDISYTYSVTFLAESMKRKTRFTNRLIAFAPGYSEPVDIGTVMMNRQKINGLLPDLPFAKQEAEYVSSVTGGKLYENQGASEKVFKSESGKYDIIHLAMHTVLNDRDPMRSTLIFSSETDPADDRYLRTYEIYSIPLRAKMVVLSSCNSGSGVLFSGEGILSLARGFMYSGCESVVMAMWEIEDRSGTEIVKSFYDNLKWGYSKSSALRKARIKYLERSDQLRSHPYFWSALVVYGNNSPLYYSKYIYYSLASALLIISVFLGFYFWRRKNS